MLRVGLAHNNAVEEADRFSLLLSGLISWIRIGACLI
jgi:hypothetical protein